MSNFSDLLTMKLIEQRRLEQGIGPRTPLSLLEGMKLVKNLNVRAPVYLIGQIEVLAEYLNMSKAELVMEMLGSSLQEAMGQIDKEGLTDSFWSEFYSHMEKNYGAVLNLGDDGKPASLSFPDGAKGE